MDNTTLLGVSNVLQLLLTPAPILPPGRRRHHARTSTTLLASLVRQLGIITFNIKAAVGRIVKLVGIRGRLSHLLLVFLFM